MRVWQDVNDARDIYISARPADGSWRTLGTIPLPLDDGLSSSGRFRYGDIALDVPLANRSSSATIEVRVWQDVRDALRIYISARPADGSWATLGTIPLPLDDGLSSSGRFRYGDIALDVPLPPRFDIPVPTVAAVEFEGEFPASERASLTEQLKREFSRVATFFAHTYGVAAPDLTIVMQRPSVGAGFGGGTIWLSDGFEEAINHEYVHALQEELSSGHGPGWMTEGVATYFELRYDEAVGDQTFETFDEGFRYYLQSARFYEQPLQTLEAGVSKVQEYAVSLMATERLADLVNDDALLEFYRQLEADTPWQSTFAEVFGITVDAFYESFEPYRLEIAPRHLYFRGTVLGPDGAPVQGLFVTPMREGEFFFWRDTTDADGTFDVIAESFLTTGATVWGDDGQPILSNDETPVVLELRTNTCEILGYMGPDGGMVERRDEAKEFILEGLTITGIVIRLPLDPWTLPIPTGCGTSGIN